MVRRMDTSDTDLTSAAAPDGGERIAKRLARAGLCSRRDAERWIAEGRVAVNGQTLETPACVVRPGDVVQVDGKVIPEPEPARLWRYHKPSGLVTSARDEKGRATVFDRLPPELPRVVSIGRLDLTTEGLLLLTNDGELARFLELPATGWTRRYRVRVFGEVDEVQLAALAKGPTIEGVKYGPIEAVLDRIQGRNAWLTVSLKEGKNREIRKVMEALGLQVNRLIRVAYGPFQLGKLEEGAVEEVPKRVVREQVANFFGAGAAPAETAESNTKLRAKARAEAASTSAAKPALRAEAAPAGAGAAVRRAPRSATKRIEAQAAWGKEDAKPSRARGGDGAKPVRGKTDAAGPAGERPARARKTLSLGDAAPKPARGGGKPSGRDPQAAKGLSKPAAASSKPAKAPPPSQPKPKPASAEAPAGPKKRDGRTDRQRVDRPRKERPSKDRPGADRRR
ncbi:23S rRNA pseudouridine2605 synthase [Azospirillum lipoferum]|nr:23S rRNA pseudouridine2605 synthase [Azospirillum lipoferum]